MDWFEISPEQWQCLLNEVKSCPWSQNEYHKCPWQSASTGGFVDLKDYEKMKEFKKHAAHVMIWSPAKDSDVLIEGQYPLKYRIPMQLRFDGSFGFAGGLIDEVKDFKYTSDNFDEFINVIRKGLVREVQEEMRIVLEGSPKYSFTCIQRDYDAKSTVQHFFTVQISLEAMESFESKFVEILEEDEVLGISRVPLYVMLNERHGYRGFPVFITNIFAGNSLEQLMKGCVTEGMLTEDQVRVAYHVASSLRS